MVFAGNWSFIVFSLIIGSAPIIYSVDAQWIVARKDFNKSVRRRARNEMAEASESPTNFDDSEDGVKMDELGCILYFHGGGYYFGSVDQERYAKIIK